MRIRPGMNISDTLKSTYNKYTSAANIKFIEQSGARVIPIFYDSSDSVLNARLKLVNGVLLPGHDDFIFDRENNYIWDTAAVTI